MGSPQLAAQDTSTERSRRGIRDGVLQELFGFLVVCGPVETLRASAFQTLDLDLDLFQLEESQHSPSVDHLRASYEPTGGVLWR